MENIEKRWNSLQQFLSFAGRTEYSKILNTIFKASEERRISLTELIDSDCYNADSVKLMQVHGMIEEDGDYYEINSEIVNTSE